MFPSRLPSTALSGEKATHLEFLSTPLWALAANVGRFLDKRETNKKIL